jgi:Mg/Co/Ni transporter MgtE
MRCQRHALTYWPVCGRAITVALIVGTILVIINQADVLLSGHITPLVVAKIGLTYVVPFSVSTYSALAANRVHRN